MILIAQTSHQAIRRIDTPCEFWVRDESGPLNLGEYTVEVGAIAYGGRHVRETWPAQGGTDGKVEFTVPAETRLGAGMYQLRARFSDGGLVHFGLLELV